jgi:hypothetical protein
MERRRVGGGLLAAAGVGLPMTIDLAGFIVPAPTGYALLAACVVGIVAGLWALFAPDRRWLPKRRSALANSEPVLKGGFTLRPDTPLADAIKFAATGNWSGDPGGLSSDGYLVALDRAILDFTQLAAIGQIRVFHRSYTDAPYEVLDKTAWFPHRVDIMDVLEGEAVMRRRKDGSRIETCHDLRVSREQWDLNWSYLRSTLH